MSDVRLPTVYIPHGGGPCFFMEWTMGAPDSWDRLGVWLRGYVDGLAARPRAVLVVSAHWEEPRVTVQTGAAPGLLFDYYGFPEHTYRLRFPAAGAPECAAVARELLESAGIECGESPDRPFDHGVFVPLMLMFPDADVPIFQTSLHASLDANLHIEVGSALEPLREQGVLIVASGMSYHNLPDFMGHRRPEASQAFDDWLNGLSALSAPERRRALAQWVDAPAARLAHPREEHLLPLMVAAGAGGESEMTGVFRDRIHGHLISAFQFG